MLCPAAAPQVRWLWRLDYSGIVLLIVMSFYPQLSYGFQCSPLLRDTYMGITALLGAVCLVMCLAPSLQRPELNKAGRCH